MNFNPGDWIVEALRVLESSRHLKIMAYGLVLAAVLHAIASVLGVLWA